jgi:hypothetical protein
MACTTGKENFPSVRSSAKPFAAAYCSMARGWGEDMNMEKREKKAYVAAIQVHHVVPNLEEHTE